MKNRECTNCGLTKKLMVKAKVAEQFGEDSPTEYTFRWLCFPCLIKVCGLETKEKAPLSDLHYFDYKRAEELVK